MPGPSEDTGVHPSTATRPYRSKKQRPCDVCRRRRVGCFVEPGQTNCTLCRHRDVSCTFNTDPAPKRGRVPKARKPAPTTTGITAAGLSPPAATPAGAGISPTNPGPGALSPEDGRSNVIGNNNNNSTATPTPCRTTVIPGRTVLYNGSSSDQDVYLLRHLPFDEVTNTFGHSTWRVSKILSSSIPTTPEYFTSYPNALLDSPDTHAMYDYGPVDALVGPRHQRELLLGLYYSYVHPSLPILESRAELEEGMKMGKGRTVPASLVAAIYLLGSKFWHLAPNNNTSTGRGRRRRQQQRRQRQSSDDTALDLDSNSGLGVGAEERTGEWEFDQQHEEGDASEAAQSGPPPATTGIDGLYALIFTSLSLESRTPSLRTIQALLLFLQTRPGKVREPNHPGFWALTCQLVGLAQDVGLHVEPGSWRGIEGKERRLRRVLWWSVYMQDKWLAHWLGRPSHIEEGQFSVGMLREDDFAGLCCSSGDGDGYLTHSISAFVALARLTTVLAKVMRSFYTINHSPCAMSPAEALALASECQARLSSCFAEHQGAGLLRDTRVINDYALVFAYYGIAVSIQRALFACVGGTSYYDVQREMILSQDLSTIFEDLLQQDLDGLWLSYCKSNIAVIGSFHITALLSSTDDDVYHARRAALEEFRERLHSLAERFEFAALPLLRLNLLLERFGDDGASGET